MKYEEKKTDFQKLNSKYILFNLQQLKMTFSLSSIKYILSCVQKKKKQIKKQPKQSTITSIYYDMPYYSEKIYSRRFGK
jgi:hypothetical protein